MEFAELKELDDDLFFKRSKINISSSRNFCTPIKVSRSPDNISEINEIYKLFSSDKLDEMVSNELIERMKNREVQKLTGNNINFFFVDYTGTHKPSKDQLEALVDIQYPYSDVIITPIFSNLMRNLKAEDQINTFLELTKKSLEIVKTLNNKPIIGIIPALLPRQSLKPLIKNYYNQGITCFAIDYGGKSVDSNMSWATSLMRLMAEYDIVENSFIYGLNVYEAHFRKNANRVLAKDFASLGYGVDILGLKHIPPRMGPDGWNEYKDKEKMFRFFDASDYSYIRYPESELLSQGPISNEAIKLDNIKKQYQESQILQTKLRESESLTSYIQTKDQITDKLRNDMHDLREEALKNQKMKKLDDFFY